MQREATSWFMIQVIQISKVWLIKARKTKEPRGCWGTGPQREDTNKHAIYGFDSIQTLIHMVLVLKRDIIYEWRSTIEIGFSPKTWRIIRQSFTGVIFRYSSRRRHPLWHAAKWRGSVLHPQASQMKEITPDSCSNLLCHPICWKYEKCLKSLGTAVITFY